jgi:hypothetical protein
MAGSIAVRGMKLRRPLSNSIFLFQDVALMSPIVFLVWIALWPLLLFFYGRIKRTMTNDRLTNR